MNSLLGAPLGVGHFVLRVHGPAARVGRLAAMGILAGTELIVRQKSPVVIVDADETSIALEREIAADIEISSGREDSGPPDPSR